MKIKHSFKHSWLLLLGVLCSLQAAAFDFGYTNGQCLRSANFRIGTDTIQGMAIRIPQEKLQLLKGSTISGIQFATGSIRTTNKQVQLFIATQLGGEALRAQDGTIAKSNTWTDVTLDNPYTITGDETELYIGFTAVIATSYQLLTSDQTADLKECCYVYNNGDWQDTYGMGLGGVNVRAVISDAPSYTDVLVKPLALSGYYRSQNDYPVMGRVLNIGPNPIHSLTISSGVTGSEYRQTVYDNLNIATGEVFTAQLDIRSNEGDKWMQVDIAVDASAAADGTAETEKSDNSTSAPVFFYPENMERSIFVENFTGQDCSNCPEGHDNLHAIIDTISHSHVLVSHHIGYQPDQFTMADQYNYLFFYGGYNTYAPAIMINRTAQSTMSCPVFNTNKTDIASMIDYVADKQPYVSLALQSKYNADTRQLDVKLQIYPHRDMPTEQTVFNVYLLQDSLRAYQSMGGTQYVHNGVFRGTLTGNAWGFLPAFEAGKTIEWETSLTLPESIRSDYWTEGSNPTYGSTDIPVVEKDMRIVAFVGAYSETDFNAHQVYNCTEVRLGESYAQAGISTGISDVTADTPWEPSFSISADGTLSLDAAEGRCEVFDLQGRCLGSRLPATGICVVKVTDKNGKTFVRKINPKNIK